VVQFEPPHCFSFGAAAQRGSWAPHSRGFWITHNDAPQSVGLLWTSDQLATETSSWQHTTLTTQRHSCPRQDSNPQSQQASGLLFTLAIQTSSMYLTYGKGVPHIDEEW